MKATQNALIAKEPENLAMDSHAPVVEEQDFTNRLMIWGFENLKMKNVGESLKHSLNRRQEAMEKFQARKREFLITREQITRDIEETRTIWQNTVNQLPRQPFNQ